MPVPKPKAPAGGDQNADPGGDTIEEEEGEPFPDRD